MPPGADHLWRAVGCLRFVRTVERRGRIVVRVNPRRHDHGAVRAKRSGMRSPALASRAKHGKPVECDKPFLSLSWPWRCAARAGQMRATISVGRRNESDEPGAWTEPRQVRS